MRRDLNSLIIDQMGRAYMICLWFKQTITAISGQPRGRMSGILSMIGIGSMLCNPRDQHLNVHVTNIKCLDAEDTCNISLTSAGE